MTDRELLSLYRGPDAKAAEAAFHQLVQRHLNLVYAIAFRSLRGNATLAEEVAQTVFIALAREARSPTNIRNLPSWLYATTRFTVAHTVRGERRRQNREQKAYVMQTLLADDSSNSSASEINEVAQFLDETLETLSEDDRTTVLLRFFNDRSFSDIGAELGIAEDAARMRLNRAIDRLRDHLARRGITCSSAVVSTALASQAIAAPPGLAAALVSSPGFIAALSTVTTKAVTFSLMTSKSIAVAASIALAASLGYSGLQFVQQSQVRAEIDVLSSERERLDRELQQSKRQLNESEKRATAAETQLLSAKAALAETKSKSASAKSPSPAEVAQRATLAAKLAKLKPQLEAGRPIRGALLVSLGGKPSEQPVAFVIGQETLVPSDEGTYRIVPTLSGEGSVRYTIMLVQKDPESGKDRVVVAPSVAQIPWSGFGLRVGNGSIIEFDCDEKEPEL